jgi:putative two-component system response regulator
MVKKDKAKTVLCVDDETDILVFACRVFELEGYCCLQATTSDEAFRAIKNHEVDLVVLDLRLAENDGWAIMKQMKSDPKTSAIPVIVCTASYGEPQKKRALNMGAADYLVKPLSAAVLRDAVARILSQKK